MVVMLGVVYSKGGEMATFTIRLKLNDELEVSMSEFYDGMNKGERQLHDIPMGVRHHYGIN